MFEVLMFLFENYMDSSATLKADSSIVTSELEKIGFNRFEIDRAMDWLDGLLRVKAAVQAGPMLTVHAIRHYLAEENEQLGIEGIGLLLHLEQLGILDPMTREIVIDRLMALDKREVDLGRIKWVVLMVLFSQPDKKSALNLLQDMVMSDAFGTLH